VISDDYWLALYVHPHKEYMVRDILQSKGFSIYLPQVRNKVQRSDRPSKRPFFPHYLFLQNPGAEELYHVRWTPGLRRIVAFEQRPMGIPNQVIQHLRKRLELFELPDEQLFKQGQAVRITGGPFEGMEATFDRRLSGKDRVRVFLAFVNQVQVPVEMDLQDLVPPD